MAAKKLKFGAKAEFVRAASKDIPAKDLVAAAQKKGIELTENYVYTIRSSTSKAARAKPGPKPGRKAGVAPSVMSPAEIQLRDAIADLGLVKAAEILSSVKATIKGR